MKERGLRMNDWLKRTMEIRTERLLLRPLTEQDAEDGLSLLLNEEVAKTYMLPEFTDRAEAEAMFGRLMRMSQSEDRVMYGIDREGRVIGWIHSVDVQDGCMEVGYAVNPVWKGLGYATEALGAVISEMFRMGVPCVTAGYFEGNEASRRVMEKCGMRASGRTEEIEYRGRVRRCVYMEIRREEDGGNEQ